MAAWLRGFLLLLLPFALAESEMPCDGFEVMEGYGTLDLETHPRLGVRVVDTMENVSDTACWEQCCHHDNCHLAIMSNGRCDLIVCHVKGFNMCELTPQEGARSFRKLDAGTQPTQEDFCLSKAETGPCRAFFVRWWYDPEAESCKTFTYGGCPVNLNNHNGEDECMEKCRGVKAKSVEPPQPAEAQVSQEDVCSGTKETGRCRAAFPRWYYDSDSNSCKTFTYGGCGGNSNNHLTEQGCIDKCVVTKPEPEPVKSHKAENFKEYCAAEAYTGNCRAAFTRWYYQPSTGICSTFTYGGCSGNKNNYLSEAECMKACSGRSEDDDHAADHILHRPLTAVVLPILLALLAATLLGVMIYSFLKVAKKNQQDSNFRAMWNPIDDKECLMNNAYTL
ncbi:kunitz-type protease inhibitor 2 [Hyperolius riggenbachi]|uniref:kunitz-type protease inhibitor 2 n=1 Tax=Hyperolius riggenbachi TaxID=752182 RepID=UPI0035A2F8E9